MKLPPETRGVELRPAALVFNVGRVRIENYGDPNKPAGSAVVFVDGVRVKRLRAIELRMAVDEAPTIRLELWNIPDAAVPEAGTVPTACEPATQSE